MYGRVTLTRAQEQFVKWATAHLVSEDCVKCLGDRQYWIKEKFFNEMQKHEKSLSRISLIALSSLRQQLLD